MRELERILPDEIKSGAVWCGDEIVLPYSKALAAIGLASNHAIAILGLEAFRVEKEGLLTVDMADASAYIPFGGDWSAYVVAANAEAERWIKEHRLGENHGYILTSASKGEFASLK